MLINWFTVIAQIINFLILVALLKKFLYKPILNAIEEREKKIAVRIEDAKMKEAVALKEQTEFANKNKEFDRQKKELMDKASEEAKIERQQLFEEARNEATALRIKLEDSINEDKGHLENEITRKARQEIFAIAKKTLHDLADSDLEEQIIKIFITRLRNTTEAEKRNLIDSFKLSPEIIVTSFFPVTESQEQEIITTVKDVFQLSARCRFETSPDLVSGIELNSNGYKIAWSISEYLNSIEKNIETIIHPNKSTNQ